MGASALRGNRLASSASAFCLFKRLRDVARIHPHHSLGRLGQVTRVSRRKLPTCTDPKEAAAWCRRVSVTGWILDLWLLPRIWF
jgi:hypothetical protein